ncbi:hypothetical protein HOP50_18g82090 [Chloropicon primus]|uniref:Uncharacterized protein n=1 Tax=Chloropicon primus TaxID=1764295 RepID=A0A5B8MYM0_9CHLO|nr:hypothetical protein A3770_18p81850 [Chloropicon primus]UPR04864.1 hypothetical protein HOP50_18g82090 [Chloropicon primus]|eukprot:QDZ25667.1 hypothetical protein A3770_18p81850 [Chloropicon primus]
MDRGGILVVLAAILGLLIPTCVAQSDPKPPGTGISIFDVANVDLKHCNRSLVNMVKAADKVVQVEQKRGQECERKLALVRREREGRERELVTSIALLERRLGDAKAAEREGAEAILGLREAQRSTDALAKDREALESKVKSLERMETHLRIRYEDRINKLERKVEQRTWLAWELGATAAVVIAVALAQRCRRGKEEGARTKAVTTTTTAGAGAASMAATAATLASEVSTLRTAVLAMREAGEEGEEVSSSAARGKEEEEEEEGVLKQRKQRNRNRKRKKKKKKNWNNNNNSKG